MIIVKYIETDFWHQVIDQLIAAGFEVTYEYDGMDAGIDYNCYKIRKDFEEIKFEWTNWDEGDMTCTPERLQEIEVRMKHTFKNVLAITSRVPGAPDWSKSNQPK